MIAFQTLGGRLAMGVFNVPIQEGMGWPRSAFSLAFAIGNLLNGFFGPMWATLIETFGRPALIMLVASALFVGGNFVFASAEHMSQAAWIAGQSILVGIGGAGISVGILLGNVGRLFPANDIRAVRKRSLVFGTVSALAQTGQFALAPLAQYLISAFGWVKAAYIIAFQAMIVFPMVVMLRKQKPRAVPPVPAPAQSAEPEKDSKEPAEKPEAEAKEPAKPAAVEVAVAPAGPRYEPVPDPPNAWAAIKEAFTSVPILLFVLAYTSCGWTVGFTSASMAASLRDRGLSSSTAAWCISVLGITSTLATFVSGILPMLIKGLRLKYLLAAIYLFRGTMLVVLIVIPATPAGVISVCVLLGLAWFPSIPVTTSLFAAICGTRWLATINSVAFAVHQLGAFLGAYLGAVEYDARGSYAICWWITAGLSLVAGVAVAFANDRSLRRRLVVEGDDYVRLGSGPAEGAEGAGSAPEMAEVEKKA
ncbi:major facilitator superfamily domain-containing protein [Hyaloraphidium curvatum]|nr:major facilitator superfamily domain-containing protein [Hyaloraphidium curvatum]